MIFANGTEAVAAWGAIRPINANRNDLVALGIPRGGIPVACEVADELHLPLDVFSFAQARRARPGRTCVWRDCLREDPSSRQTNHQKRRMGASLSR